MVEKAATVKTVSPASKEKAPAPKVEKPAPEAVPVKVETAEQPKPKSKEQLYRLGAQRLNEKVQEYFKPVQERQMKRHNEEIKMRQVFGDQDIRDLVVFVFGGIFDILLQPGADGVLREATVGIPGGFGSMQLATAGATRKTTPQGTVVEVQKRWRVKYSPGKMVDQKLAQLPPPPQDEEGKEKDGEAVKEKDED